METAPKKRRWGRWLLGTLLLMVLLVVAAPTLLSTGPGSSFLLGRILPGLNGRATVGALNLGWLSPPAVDQLEIRSADDQPAINVGTMRMDKPLWKLAVDRTDLGIVRIERPVARVVATGQGTNLSTLFRPQVETPKPDTPNQPRTGPLYRVEIVDGQLSWLPLKAEQEWGVDKLNFVLGVRPGPAGDTRPEMYIDKTTILDHAKLTPGMCNDVFKFVAPILTETTQTQGELSLALDGGAWPLGDFQNGTLAGTMSLHEVTVGPGPLVQKIAGIFRLPDYSIQLAREADVKFALDEGRVRHDGMEFGIGELLKVKTSGTVALEDQALDLVAEVRVHVKTNPEHNRPLLEALNEQVIRLPIKGTLKKPQVDASALPAAGVSLLQAVLGQLREGKPLSPAEELLAKLREQGIVPKPPADGQPGAEGKPAIDVPTAALEILGGLMQRRRQQQQKQTPDATTPETPPERKRPLGRLLDRLRQPPEEDKPK